MYDLLKAKIYHIEKVEKKRKRYPETDAIYFLTPTQKSINFLLRDFSDKTKVQYGCVHLCFTGHVSEALMNKISSNKELVSRIFTL